MPVSSIIFDSAVMTKNIQQGERVVELNKIYNMDCIVGMAMIPDKSVDMILETGAG